MSAGRHGTRANHRVVAGQRQRAAKEIALIALGRDAIGVDQSIALLGPRGPVANEHVGCAELGHIANRLVRRTDEGGVPRYGHGVTELITRRRIGTCQRRPLLGPNAPAPHECVRRAVAAHAACANQRGVAGQGYGAPEEAAWGAVARDQSRALLAPGPARAGEDVGDALEVVDRGGTYDERVFTHRDGGSKRVAIRTRNHGTLLTPRGPAPNEDVESARALDDGGVAEKADRGAKRVVFGPIQRRQRRALLRPGRAAAHEHVGNTLASIAANRRVVSADQRRVTVDGERAPEVLVGDAGRRDQRLLSDPSERLGLS